MSAKLSPNDFFCLLVYSCFESSGTYFAYNIFAILFLIFVALIKSISGIRGTVGGKPGDGLSPVDIVKFTAAFGTWVKKRSKEKRIRIVVGRDARISGDMVNRIVTGTLIGLGIDVIDIGLSTT